MNNIDMLTKRFDTIFTMLTEKDEFNAMALLFPLIDSAAKKRYGIKKVGERIRKLVTERKSFLYFMFSNGALNVVEGGGIVFSLDGERFELEKIVYKLMRTYSQHEDAPSEKLVIVDECRFGPDSGRLVFPRTLVWGLTLMLSFEDAYKHCVPKGKKLELAGNTMLLDEAWGDESKIRTFFSSVWKRPGANLKSE